MKNSVKFANRTRLSAAFIFAMAALSLPAQAHEFRQYGTNYAVELGNDVEPTAVNIANGIDFIAYYDDGAGNLTPLDKAAGDTVDVAVIPITVKNEKWVAGASDIVEADPIFFNFVQGDVEGITAYIASGWTPDNDDIGNNGPGSGFHGYLLTAHLKKAGTSGSGKWIALDKFVCGNGSKDLNVGGSFFECVTL
jgi:hypothetical protein